MGKLHHAFTGTGAIATAVAANIPGKIVADCLQNQIKENQVLRIGHSAGTLETSASTEVNIAVGVQNRWFEARPFEYVIQVSGACPVQRIASETQVCTTYRAKVHFRLQVRKILVANVDRFDD